MTGDPRRSVSFESEERQNGFTMIPNRVLLDARLSPAARLTYGLLVHYARQEESCYPGQARLAKCVGVSDRQLRDYIGELKKAELVEVIREGNRRTNRYVLLDPDRNSASGPDRKPASGRDRNSASGPIEKETQGEGDAGEEHSAPDPVNEIFEFWRSTFRKDGKTKLTAGRRRSVQARLREGYTPERIRRAILGCAGSEFHVKGGHTDLTLICRNGEKVEQFEARPEPPGGLAVGVVGGPNGPEPLRRDHDGVPEISLDGGATWESDYDEVLRRRNERGGRTE